MVIYQSALYLWPSTLRPFDKRAEVHLLSSSWPSLPANKPLTTLSASSPPLLSSSYIRPTRRMSVACTSSCSCAGRSSGEKVSCEWSAGRAGWRRVCRRRKREIFWDMVCCGVSCLYISNFFAVHLPSARGSKQLPRLPGPRSTRASAKLYRYRVSHFQGAPSSPHD